MRLQERQKQRGNTGAIVPGTELHEVVVDHLLQHLQGKTSEIPNTAKLTLPGIRSEQFLSQIVLHRSW
jgi:hypothetical protein